MTVSDSSGNQGVSAVVNIAPFDEISIDISFIALSINETAHSKTTYDSSTTVHFDETSKYVLMNALSPNYPFNYPNNAHVEWLLYASEGEIFTVNVEKFSTESCCDELVIYDGSSVGDDPLAVLSGDYYSTTYVSSGSSVLAVFTSDSSITDDYY